MLDQLTVVVFTFNEAERLPVIIRNFRNFARILVVDNESTDRTVEIARANNCEVLINKNLGWVEDEVTAARVKASVQTEWIYWGFADELIRRDSLKELLSVIDGGRYDIIRLKRKNYLYGVFCHDALAGYQTKFFKKHAIDFTGNRIHEFGRVTVPAARIYDAPSDQFVGHFIDDTISSYLDKINRYTALEQGPAPGSEVPFVKMFVLAPFKIFFVDYLLRGGFKAGVPGLVLVFTQMVYSWIKAIKLYERRHDLARHRMEQIYKDVKNDYC